MYNSFYSKWTNVKCYTYLGAASAAFIWGGYKILGTISVFPLCALVLCHFGIQYYGPLLIGESVTSQNITNISSSKNLEEMKDLVSKASKAVKLQIKKRTGQDYENIAVFLYDSETVDAYAQFYKVDGWRISISSELVKEIMEYKGFDDKQKMLEGLLAHEFGHIYFNSCGLNVSLISRQVEYNADSFAAQLGYVEGLQHALIGLCHSVPGDVAKPRFDLRGLGDLLDECLASHPSLNNRLIVLAQANRRDTAEQNKSIISRCKDDILFYLKENLSHFTGVDIKTGELRI